MPLRVHKYSSFESSCPRAENLGKKGCNCRAIVPHEGLETKRDIATVAGQANIPMKRWTPSVFVQDKLTLRGEKEPVDAASCHVLCLRARHGMVYLAMLPATLPLAAQYLRMPNAPVESRIFDFEIRDSTFGIHSSLGISSFVIDSSRAKGRRQPVGPTCHSSLAALPASGGELVPLGIDCE